MMAAGHPSLSSLILVSCVVALPSFVSAQSCTSVTLSSTDDRQTVSTPGYPSGYGADLNVCWLVDTSGIAQQGDETYVVQLEVTDTDMEKLGSSCYDYGEALDGATNASTRLAKWCDGRPYPVVSSGNFLFVRFFTSSTNANGGVFKGFSARVQVAVRAGGGTMASVYTPTCTPFALAASNVTYTLTTPDYPANYANSMDKCWVLYVDTTVANRVNYRVRLQVLDSVLEVSTTCHYDDVQARDGDTPTSALIQMWCGATIPAALTSCDQYMYVRMRTDHFGTYRGFHALVSVVSKSSTACTLAPTSLSTGTIIGIVMGCLFVVVLVIVIVVVCKVAKKKTKVRVRHVQPKHEHRSKDGHHPPDAVPVPQVKHPSYYNQAVPDADGYQAPVHGATIATGYAKPAAPAYMMSGMMAPPGQGSGMPEAY